MSTLSCIYAHCYFRFLVIQLYIPGNSLKVCQKIQSMVQATLEVSGGWFSIYTATQIIFSQLVNTNFLCIEYLHICHAVLETVCKCISNIIFENNKCQTVSLMFTNVMQFVGVRSCQFAITITVLISGSLPQVYYFIQIPLPRSLWLTILILYLVIQVLLGLVGLLLVQF